MNIFRSNRRGCRNSTMAAAVCLLLSTLHLHAQYPTQNAPAQTSTAAPDTQRIADIERRLNEVTAALNQSLEEIQALRAQLAALQGTTVHPTPATPETASSSAPKDDHQTLQDMKEQQETLEAQVKQHEQIKVETVSKYPLRVSGLILFNTFANAGSVDNVELPTIALMRFPGASHGSSGATLRQTLLAIDAIGPRFAGARTSAEASLDFFGGVASNASGYAYAPGLVRMRQSQLSLDWTNTTAQVGYSGPLISPLSPTSYAMVAYPALAASGNLWTWSPQLRVEQHFPITGSQRLALEGGLIYPQSPGYTSTQLDSPVEASRRPGYEGRVSYRMDTAAAGDHPFVLGFGGYSANQFYSSAVQVHSWAVTADWQVPLRALDLSGEFYRGRALGGLGGGGYKDVVTGTDTLTGLGRTVGADTVGGWSQLKLHFSPTVETNAAFGLDDVLASNFDGLVLTTTGNPNELNARTASTIGNLIFRPKTYLIFSPEYRRILTWRYTGAANVANIYTISAGFQF